MSAMLGEQQRTGDDEEARGNPESAGPQEAVALGFEVSGMLFLH